MFGENPNTSYQVYEITNSSVNSSVYQNTLEKCEDIYSTAKAWAGSYLRTMILSVAANLRQNLLLI